MHDVQLWGMCISGIAVGFGAGFFTAMRLYRRPALHALNDTACGYAVANLLLLIVAVTAAMRSYGTAFNWQVWVIVLIALAICFAGEFVNRLADTNHRR